MNAMEPPPETRGPSRRVRTVTVLAVMSLLLLVPSVAAVVLAINSPVAAGGSSPTSLATAWDKPVHFIESGLAAGTTWSVDLSGSLESSPTPEINFSEIPDTYPFTVTPVAGYTASPSAGNVTVNSCMATVYVTFTPVVRVSAYAVSFTPTGLPASATWWVEFNGTNVSANGTSSITFTVPNGTYVFAAPGLIPGSVGTQYTTNLTNGTVVVSGANVTIVIPYATEYLLTMNTSPAGDGSVTPGSGWYLSGTSVNLTEVPSEGYTFIGWNGNGTGNYSGPNATPTTIMDSPIQETGLFGLAYAVDFEETGLLDGVTWSVTFNGVAQSAFFVFLDFSAVNGTYAYSVAPIAGYHTPVYQGNVTVAGADLTLVVPWVRLTYNASFVESGLPSGTSWGVTLNGTRSSSVTSTILFRESNGSYPWAVGSVSGYTANVTGGTVIVNGAAILVQIGWTSSEATAPSFTVTFIETGLARGTSWTATLNGSGSRSAGSTSNMVLFRGLAAGSYTFWVPGVGASLATPGTGSFAISTANETVNVAFSTQGAGVPPATAGSQMITVLDLLVFAVVGGGVLTAVYLIHRLSGRHERAGPQSISSRGGS